MKGGCEIGKKSGQGGCKTGKKKKVKAPPKIAAAIKARKLKAAEPKKAEKKPKPKIKFKVVKKEVKKPMKKKIKFKIKPAELPELKAITGLTKAQANKLDPAVLFGMLPKELAKDIVLKPSVTGVKVGTQSLEDVQSRLKKAREISGDIKATEIKRMKNMGRKLTIAMIKKEMPDGGRGFSGYSKDSLIELLARKISENKSGVTDLFAKEYNLRMKKKNADKESEKRKQKQEIIEANKNPKKPTEKRMEEYRIETNRRNVALKMMKGSRYDSTRKESKMRFDYKFRDVIAWLKK